MKKILIISFLFLSFNVFGGDWNPWSSIKKNPDDLIIKSIIVNSKNIGAARIFNENEGIEKLETSLPAVLTCDLRLNTPRFASLPNIMKAKKKPLDIIEIDTLGIDTESKIKVLNVVEPPKREAGIMVSDVKELVQKLKYEAKVI